jgi:hypothetical protein
MPIALQAERLEQQLRSRGVTRFAVSTPDLYDLDGADRDVALDAIVEGRPSPYVIIEGRLVCSGAVRFDEVLAAVS